jgi:hypothetical protein
MVTETELNGALNPTWVEWLMGWPLFWTSLSESCYDSFNQWRKMHENKQRTQAGAEEHSGVEVRNVWWDVDPSAPPQERERLRQFADERGDSVPDMPLQGACDNRELGTRPSEASNVQNMRGTIQAEANTEVNFMWEPRMPEREWPQISRVEVGVKCRVDRLRCTGNGQVPGVAAMAWRILSMHNKKSGE